METLDRLKDMMTSPRAIAQWRSVLGAAASTPLPDEYQIALASLRPVSVDEEENRRQVRIYLEGSGAEAAKKALSGHGMLARVYEQTGRLDPEGAVRRVRHDSVGGRCRQIADTLSQLPPSAAGSNRVIESLELLYRHATDYIGSPAETRQQTAAAMHLAAFETLARYVQEVGYGELRNDEQKLALMNDMRQGLDRIVGIALQTGKEQGR